MPMPWSVHGSEQVTVAIHVCVFTRMCRIVYIYVYRYRGAALITAVAGWVTERYKVGKCSALQPYP